MSKVDLKKEIASYRARRGKVEIVDVPSMRYFMIDGEGDPHTGTAYADAIATLFSVSYKLRFASKRELDRDYAVAPLEALWWADDMAAFTERRDKSRWSWTAMILVPDWITPELIDGAIAAADDAPSIAMLRVEELDEGRCVQTLHVGPYDDEGPVLAQLHDEFIPAHKLAMTGRHHEIYLSDARRTDPAKLRTILRQPVTDA